MTLVQVPAATLVVTLALYGPLRAQAPAPPGAGSVSVASGATEHVVARLVNGRLVAAAPCVAAEGPLDAAGDWRVAATGPHQVVVPRHIQVGSEDWNRVAPRLLALADRREREQRLAARSMSGVPRFLDWVFVGDARGDPLYYFETSRRIPSPPVDPDTADTDPPGTLRLAVSGFARIDSNGATPLGTKGELRWEEDSRPRGPTVPDLRPLGIVLTASDQVWVMEGRTPAASTVSLFSVGARGTSLVSATRIGRC